MRIIKDENENIDIIKSKERYFSTEHLKDYYNYELISRECLKLGLGAVVLTSLPNTDPFFFPKPIIYYIIGRSILDFVKACFPEGLTKQEIDFLIKNSEQYAECSELYKKYIQNIASFSKSLNLKIPLELATFIDFNLGIGMFNPDFEIQKYEAFKYQPDFYLAEISGSTVITGTSICRHNAPFLTDVLNSSGIKACNILVKSYPLQVFKKNSKKLESLRANHMVSGIIDNDENFIFDPTNHNSGYFTSTEILSGVNSDYLLITNDLKNKDFADFLCYIIDEEESSLELYKKFNAEEYLTFQNFINKKHKKADFNYQKYLQKEVIFKIQLHQKEILDFHRENKKTLQKIKKLNETLGPKSNEKITNWRIK